MAQRLREYPQPTTGGALTDPLPIPFTRDEIKTALRDVWLASHKPLNRSCANIDPASVRIALLVLGILQQRNGGWINLFSGRPPATASFVTQGQGVNLKCILYKLVGKPIPPIYNYCTAIPPRPQAIYYISDVKTTFDPSVIGSSDVVQIYVLPSPPGVEMDRPGGEGGAQPGGMIGLDLEQAEPVPVGPFVYSLFEVSGVFDIKGN